MGLRGPVPKPTEIKRLEGNPGRRPLNSHEPMLPVKLPGCPVWLSADAKREYKRIGKLLVTMRLVTEADLAALVTYADAYARYKQATQAMSAPGFEMVQETDKGYSHINAWLTVSQSAVKQMKAMMLELGLTPAARSRIEAQPADEQELSLADKLFAGVSAIER